VANPQTIVITWTPNTETDLAGYVIYFGRRTNGVITYSSFIDVPNATAISIGHTMTFTTASALGLTHFTSDGLWFITMSAYDAVPNESAKQTPQSKRMIRTANRLKVRR
jgi:hypothetical protein